MKLGGSLALAAALTFAPNLCRAESKDPTIASLLSAGTVVFPVGITTALWLTGKGTDDNLRLNAGMIFLGVGSILGPASGLIYAGAGSDAVVTLLLRGVTGAVLLTGLGLAYRGNDEGVQDAGTAVAAVGAVPTGALVIYDIWAASDAVIESRRARGYTSRSKGPDIAIGSFSLCSASPWNRRCR